MVQRLGEGWLLDNPRSGYPFGSSFADYPNADGASLLLLKAFGAAGADFQVATSLFFLPGFGAIFIAAYAAMRAHGLARPLAFAAALLFDFAPFHFQRMQHLFYTMYVVVPVFYYLAWRLWQPGAAPTSRRARLWYAAGLLALGSFGVYYAFFGLLVVATAAAASLLREPRGATVRSALAIVLLVGAGVALNMLPNRLAAHPDGPNPEVAQRLPSESEVYGFKFVQLLMPRTDHRIGAVADYAYNYFNTTPLTNENATANLGAAGAAGLLALLCAAAAALAGRSVAPDVRLLALVVAVLLMFGWIGAFGSLFAHTVSPSLRGWNRISIFIAYGALLGGALLLQPLLHGRRRLTAALAALLVVAGMFDQTSRPPRDRVIAVNRAFADDRAFVAAIEASLPPASAVYQLPYMAFPEVGARERLQAYDHMAGVLHSRALRWNYAGMKGREGDLFYRALDKEALATQLDVLRRLGFAGIYVDRRGYADQGQAVMAGLQALLGAGPALVHAHGEKVFYRLPGQAHALAPGQDPLALMRRAAFFAGPMGRIVDTPLAEGVDFTREQVPLFLKRVTGLSNAEADGRWSDANLASSVRLHFRAPLPRRFTLEVSGRPFGPNLGRELTIRVGGRSYRQRMDAGYFTVRQPVRLDAPFDQVELILPQPVSPRELGASLDARKLGVKFARIRLLVGPAVIP
ncbi:MAG: sugar translocase [Pseudomonadota bacterium]